MRLKVLHVVARLDMGGAQLNTLSVVRRLDRKRFLPMLAAGTAGQLAADARGLEGVQVFLLGQLCREINPVLDAAALVRLVLLCRRERVDIVHTHGSKAGVLGRWAARAAGVPVIVHTVHGWSFHAGQSAYFRRCAVRLERLSARVTACLVAVSRACVEQGLENGIGDRGQYRVR